MDLNKALKGIGNWRPKPLVAPSVVAVSPPEPIGSEPMTVKPAETVALDSLITAAVQAIQTGGDLPVPPALPEALIANPALMKLRDDLSIACADASKSGKLPVEMQAFQRDLERFHYPAGFFDSELLPLITPNRSRLVYKVLRIEPERVVLIAPGGDDNCLYHPAHNPGLGR